jgi:hypothetical protein
LTPFTCTSGEVPQEGRMMFIDGTTAVTFEKPCCCFKRRHDESEIVMTKERDCLLMKERVKIAMERGERERERKKKKKNEKNG